MRTRFPRIAFALGLAGLGLLVPPASAEPRVTVESSVVDAGVASIGLKVTALPPAVAPSAIRSTVTVSGKPVPSTTTDAASRTDRPAGTKTLVIAVDSSQSMVGGRLFTAKLGARELVEQLSADVRVGVVGFGYRSEIKLQPTTDHAAVIRAINGLRPSGGTALYDAIVDACSMLTDLGDRRVLVFTDGDDSTSRNSLERAVTSIRDAAARIDSVQLGEIPTVRTILERFADPEGGSLLRIEDRAQLLDVYKDDLAATEATIKVNFRIPEGVENPKVKIVVQIGDAAVTVFRTLGVTQDAQTGSGTNAMEPWVLVALAVVFGLSLLIFLLLVSAGSDRSRRRRIEQVLAIRAEIRGLEQELAKGETTALEALEDLVRPVLRYRNLDQRLTLELDGAGLNFSPEQWILVRTAAVFATFTAFTVVGGLVFGFAGGLLGYIAPKVFINRRRRGRAAAFEAGLPDALLIMASTLRSGFSLEQSIVSSADQSEGPVATQLRRALQEVRLGLPLETALSRVAERMSSSDFSWVVAALQIQRKSGGNLSELLTTAAGTVRERGEIRREVQSLTAEGRISANVLMALPFGILLYMLAVQPEYIAPLWTTAIGRLLSGLGIVMLGLGWFSMKQVTRVEV